MWNIDGRLYTGRDAVYRMRVLQAEIADLDEQRRLAVLSLNTFGQRVFDHLGSNIVVDNTAFNVEKVQNPEVLESGICYRLVPNVSFRVVE